MEKRDVVVVGAGPGGSAAAMKCAEYGFSTLLLEKKQLPRDKICTGMIMGPVAYNLIEQEFGEIPESIFSQPSRLKGIALHVPDIGSRKLENVCLLTWRRNLDYWMNQKAESQGAELWQDARVISLQDAGQGFRVKIKKGTEECEVESEFIIGADGAGSMVRKFLFPDFKVRYSPIYEEFCSGEFGLEKDYIHWFYPIEHSPLNFSVHCKDDLIIIDTGGRGKVAIEQMDLAKEFLCKNHGCYINPEPIWRGGCLTTVLYRELISKAFLPAKEKALLVGDAAGFPLPISGEGIGTALKSGILSASSIKESLDTNSAAGEIYLEQIGNIIKAFGELYPWPKRFREEAQAGGQSLPDMLYEAYKNTLITF